LRGLDAVVDDVRRGLPARVRLPADLTPGRRLFSQVAPEPTLLRARPGQYRQKSPPAARNMAHVVPCAELAVGYVQEVGVADHLAQEVPSLDVDLVVGNVAVVGLAMDRHSAVGADRDAEDQLLQVGAVILVVAEGDAWRTVALLGRFLALVGPSEG